MVNRANLNMCLAMLLLLALTWPGVAAGAVFHVDAGAPGPIHDGTSWATAYKYVQEALAVAAANDEIWVAAGTYKPDANSADPNGNGDRTASFELVSGIAVRGGYAGLGQADPNARDVELYQTILSGDLACNDADVIDACDLLGEPNRAENCYHVVTVGSTVAYAVVDGFTISGGHANSPDGHTEGGGIYCTAGSVTVSNCTITGNTASGAESYPDGSGGGIYCSGGGSVTVQSCTISKNAAAGADVETMNGGSAWGGGLCCYPDSNLAITGSTISDNIVRGGDTQYMLRRGGDGVGGGIFFSSAGNLSIDNCVVRDNRATGGDANTIPGWGWGGGMHYSGGDSNPTVAHCTFSGNSADIAGASYALSSMTFFNCTFSGNSATHNGGAMHNHNAGITFVVGNCAFTDNSAGNDGGGIDNSVIGSMILTNCTFAGNSASRGGAVLCDRSSMTLNNCILWGDSAPDGPEICLPNANASYPASMTVGYSDVEGGPNSVVVGPEYCTLTWGDGNIDLDPNFVDPNHPDPNQRDYHLMPGSPCIDVGDPNGDYSGHTDIDDDPRVCGDRVDMGSDEVMWASVEDLGQGQSVVINPGGGSNDPNEEILVVIENVSGPNDANVVVTEIKADPHKKKAAKKKKKFKALNKTVVVETSLDKGQYEMTIVIPIEEADLKEANVEDPFKVSMMHWDLAEQDWKHAVEDNSQPGKPTEKLFLEEATHKNAPTLEELKARGPGAHGVFWDRVKKKGFVWANVDHTTDFQAMGHNVADLDVSGDVTFSDLAWFGQSWLMTECYQTPDWCVGSDLTGEGDVDLNDLREFAANWLEGTE